MGRLDLGARLDNKKITAMRGATSSVFLDLELITQDTTLFFF